MRLPDGRPFVIHADRSAPRPWLGILPRISLIPSFNMDARGMKQVRATITRSVLLALLAYPIDVPAQSSVAGPPAKRMMNPADLFRIERVGAVAWSPDWSRAAVEIHRPGDFLDFGTTADIAVIDARTGRFTMLTHSSPVIGFFQAVWSPDSRRLMMLSVDSGAVVRPWLWTAGDSEPVLLGGMQLRDGTSDPPFAAWSDNDHLLLMVRDSTLPNDGPQYARTQRGRNVADRWLRVRDPGQAVVDVYESRATSDATVVKNSSRSRIVSVDLRSHEISVLAEGPVHRPSVSRDGRTVTYRQEGVRLSSAPASLFFGPDAHGEEVYDDVNWGRETLHVDSRTGARVAAPATSPGSRSAAPVSLRVRHNASEGSSLILSRDGQPDREVWHGNEWVSGIEAGRAEAISYRSVNGEPLTGWVLYPPGYSGNRRLPVVMVVYPGRVYGPAQPSAIDILSPNFEHPQLFAALGYAVVLPSMPQAGNPLQSDALAALTDGVLPLLDTLVARGIADSARIAVLGQSAGGWATLGLITQTDRFRSAIASASLSNLTSLYGTFYGQYRYGDSGDPQRAQLLRMLQFERGWYRADAPPWEQPDRYRLNSPISYVDRVRTPLMLVHGDIDFVPVQQAEEFFTALYRQDKRVTLVRYAGEQHTIAARGNVLDLWERLHRWLQETMSAGSGAVCC